LADGTIKIRIDVDGKQLELTNKDLDQVEKRSHKAGSGIKKFAASLGLVAVGAMAFKTLRGALDDAITRFDTLNKFPKVLQALGVSAEDSERAMAKLSDGIDGLPTKLDDIAHVAQRMYTSFGDMDKATDSALALNNALLGSGASADQARRGTEMYLKMLQTGRIDMTTWNTLSETMDVGLVKIAESFGFAGKTAKDDLYSALKDGTITLDEFNDALIEVGTGTGIMAKLARENTLGIATSFENLKTAAVRGLVEIIDSFNELSKRVTGREIARNIDSLKRVVYNSFRAMARVIDRSTPVVVLFAKGLEITFKVIKALTPAIVGLMAAYGTYVVITRAAAAIQAAQAALQAAITTTVGASSAMTSLTIVQQASTKAAQADMIIRALQNKELTLSQLLIGLLTGRLKLATAAQIVMTTASKALGAAIRFMLGPIGLAITAVGLLTTGAILLTKYLKSTSSETQQLTNETNELMDAVESLSESVDDNAKSYKDKQKEMQETARQNDQLISKLNDLLKHEEMSSAQKRDAKVYVDQLNESIQGLNLTFDEETQALNMTSEELERYVKLNKDIEEGIAARERLNEISREQMEIESELEEINRLREEWNEKLEGSGNNAYQARAKLAELDATEKELKETNAELAEQYEETQTQIESSVDAITQAIKDGVADQIITYESLPPHLQEVVESMKDTWQDYESYTTDMFDTLSDKIELTASEMADNLEENQRIVSEWADNIAILAERGVDDGLLDKLREAGPESAGHVNALVNASDEELERLNDVFSSGGQVATDALAKSLGIEESAVLDAVGHLVSDTEATLKEQISAAGFDKTGEDVAKGLAEGIVSGAHEAEAASEDMADDVISSAESTLGIQSPSTVFKQIGLDVDRGLAKGIEAGKSYVIKAVKDMFRAVEKSSTASFKGVTKTYDNAIKSMTTTLNRLPVVTQQTMTKTTTTLQSNARQQQVILMRVNTDYNNAIKRLQTSLNRLPVIITNSFTRMTSVMRSNARVQVSLMRSHATNLRTPFNGLNAQMRSIGVNAMAGLTAGLRAGSGVAIATARNTANQIRATMQNALKIQSPSVVMRDEVGRWIPAGIAEGIEKYSRMIDGAINNMYQSIVPHTAPETVLATPEPVHVNVGGTYEFTIVSEIDGRKLAKETVVFTAEELESLKKRDRRR